MKTLLLFFIIFPTIIIADTVLWCDGSLEKERTWHYIVTIAPQSEFYDDGYGEQEGPVCEIGGFWTSETNINTNLNRKHDEYNLSIEDQFWRVKNRHFLVCDAHAGKSADSYIWFRFNNSNFARELNRSTLTLKRYENSRTRFKYDQCEVTNQESALSKYKGLIEKQKKVNEKLTKDSESKNVI